jgi:5'-deoxynucleotidase YfbR-like HD superfamily hydrolase
MPNDINFFDPQLDAVSAFLANSVEGAEAVQRWKKYVEHGATPENDLQHTFSASLLAILIIETFRKEVPEFKFDAYAVLRCVVLHDMGEIKEQDTHYVDKTPESDLNEVASFASMLKTFDSELADALLTGYLLQFATPSSKLSSGKVVDKSLRAQLQKLSEKQHTEALIFEAIERYGYLVYAYREYKLRNDIEILVQVLRNQRPRLHWLAQALPAFSRRFYTPALDEAVGRLLETNQELYPEFTSFEDKEPVRHEDEDNTH